MSVKMCCINVPGCRGSMEFQDWNNSNFKCQKIELEDQENERVFVHVHPYSVLRMKVKSLSTNYVATNFPELHNLFNA